MTLTIVYLDMAHQEHHYFKTSRLLRRDSWKTLYSTSLVL
jgi:hypothetical protein